jgi:nicotinamide mononucleotide transporter
MIETLFSQYQNSPVWQIWLDLFAFIFGILSVWFAKKQNILVFPTGIISTIITVYVMYKASYLADMSINIYYTIMSLYGWYKWTHFTHTKSDDLQITRTNITEKTIGFGMFIITVIVCVFIYKAFGVTIQTNNWLDIITTGIFFTAMWFMALKKIENWTLWIIGDILVIPIFWSRELYIFALLYLVYTFLAFMAYIEWKKHLTKQN